MREYLLPYLLLMAHFISGGLWLIRITGKLEPEESKQQWIKYMTYLLLVNLLWSCMLWAKTIFPFVGWTILLLAWFELGRAVKHLRNKIGLIFAFLLISGAFAGFVSMDTNILLFTYFVVVLFDGSCQVVGQLLGKRSLFSKISPRKTVEGLLGGSIITLATAVLTRHSFAFGWGELILRTSMLMVAAATGDLLASAVKRSAHLASFGRMLPGHGGILDRFDSLMMAGALTFLFTEVQNWIR